MKIYRMLWRWGDRVECVQMPEETSGTAPVEVVQAALLPIYPEWWWPYGQDLWTRVVIYYTAYGFFRLGLHDLALRQFVLNALRYAASLSGYLAVGFFAVIYVWVFSIM